MRLGSDRATTLGTNTSPGIGGDKLQAAMPADPVIRGVAFHRQRVPLALATLAVTATSAPQRAVGTW